MEGRSHSTKVCVTGGAGYIASCLVKKLLQRGYTVHTTLRNLGDESKVGLLKSFPNAEANLVIFQADLYEPSEFEKAIEGCETVFHVATPLLHDPEKAKGKDNVESTVDGVKSIADACLRQQRSIKRLIYTASVLAASPLHEDGKSFKSVIDESCWTPLHLQFPHSNNNNTEYTRAKTLAEKAVLGYNEDSELEVVSLACGFVGGEATFSQTPETVEAIVSQVIGNLLEYEHLLRYLEDVLDSVPLVHVDDVAEAHIFAMEKPSMKGRFICAVGNPTSRDMALYIQENYSQYPINQRFMGEPGSGTSCGSSKLRMMGFEFKYDVKKIIDDCMKYVK